MKRRAHPLRAEEPAIRAAYRDEMRQTVAGRVPAAWAVFIGFRAAAGALVSAYFPARLGANLTLLAALAASAVANAWLVRARAAWTIPATAAAAVFGVGMQVVYFLYVHVTIGESVVIIFMLFLTGLVLLFPWGITGQLVTGVSAFAGYLIVLAAGAPSALPPAFGILALAVGTALTIVGADLLDRYRAAAYCQARRAERASTAKSEFLGIVSHELRAPLTVIAGYADLLLGDAADEATQDGLGRIRMQAVQMRDLIQALLDLDRLAARGTPEPPQVVRVDELLAGLRADLPVTWGKAGVRLEWPSAPPPLVMHTRRREVEMILRNLIHNALKYTETGAVTVDVHGDAGGERIEFVVSDTGPGIPEEERAIIFERFGQSRTNVPREGGVGLGLFIVKRFTDALGGTIRVDSTRAVGSRFTVSLPRTVTGDA